MLYDVAVVGAGPAGAITARELSRLGRKVILIDTGLKPQRKVGESLPAASRKILTHLDLMSLVEKSAHITSYGNCSAWGSSELMMTDFIRDPNGPGWHLNRVQFDADLVKCALDAGVKWLTGRVQKLTAVTDGYVLDTGYQKISCRWLVDATGRSCFISKQLGAKKFRDDELMAVYAWFNPKESDLDTRTVVESAANGWWYTSKLPDKSRIVVFHTDIETATIMLRTQSYWQKTIQKTKFIRGILSKGRWATNLLSCEASGGRLSQFVGENWIAVGDSAMTFDPLSSQGLFNALYCAMKASQAVHQALLGNQSGLQEYILRLENIRQIYVQRNRLYYSQEQRWPTQPFWKKRLSLEQLAI